MLALNGALVQIATHVIYCVFAPAVLLAIRLGVSFNFYLPGIY